MANLLLYDDDSDKSYSISFSTKGTLEDLLKSIINEGIDVPDNCVLYTKSKKMDFDKTYCFEENQKITMKNADFFECAISFNDVTKEKIKKLKVVYSKKGDEKTGRTVCCGINLFGICTNKNCKKNGKEVIQMIIKDEYDLVENGGLMECPICNCPCQAKTVGFYKCYYNIYGLKFNKKTKQNEEYGKKITNFKNITLSKNNTVNIDGKEYKINKAEDDCISKFSEENGEARFIELFFQVKKL